MNAELKRNLLGEFIGTFILVLFGCGSLASTLALGAFNGIVQLAVIWGLGLAIALYVGGPLSGGHFNPAVTLAFAVFRGFPKSKVLPYILTQVTAAFVAAALLFTIFSSAISNYESQNQIVRGQAGSEATAMVFGGYFPNPAGKSFDVSSPSVISEGGAFFAEVIGTALFVLIVMGVTDVHNKQVSPYLSPLLIGLTLAILYAVLAPLTLASLNTARDFGPRLFSALKGWGSIPFTVNGLGWLTVYILGPFIGGLLGGRAYSLLFKPSYEEA